MSFLPPFLLALFLAVSAYSEVRPFGTLREAAVCALVLLLLAGALFGLFRLWVKKTDKAALLAAVLLFTLGLAEEIPLNLRRTCAASPLPLLHLVGSRAVYSAALSALLLLPLLLGVALIRTRRNLHSLNQAVTAGLIALLLTSLGTLWLDRRDAICAEATRPVPLRLKTPKRPPDIYFIVIDGHTSLTGLRDFWQYDSKELSDFLRQNGFRVAPGATSEYQNTTFSLASRLNMRYPPPVFENWQERYSRNAMIRIIEKSAAPALLASAGYKIVNLSMVPLAMADARYPLSAFLCTRSVRQMIWDRSVFRVKIPFRLSSRPRARKSTAEAEARAKLQPLVDLEAIAAEKAGQPRFVFVHSMITHEPYLFNPDGSHHEPVIVRQANNRVYLDQLRFADQQLIRIVRHILEKSARPPVIILQGDHGFRHCQGSAATRDKESYGMLNAILLPGLEEHELTDDFPPVNTFRLVFNHLFDAGLPYLTNPVPPAANSKGALQDE